MIDKLLAIAERREKTALAAQGRQKAVVEKASLFVEQCHKTLTDFKNWRPEEENRLFTALCEHPCNSKELDGFQAKLAGLQQQENHHQQALDNARAQLQEQQQLLSQCHDQYQAATKKLQKFKELQSRQQDEERIHENIKQELEQEDRPDSSDKGLLL